jgi:hypothetical protein
VHFSPRIHSQSFPSCTRQNARRRARGRDGAFHHRRVRHFRALLSLRDARVVVDGVVV